MNISCTWSDFKTIYPDKGVVVIFTKDVNNDVPTVVVGMLEGPDKVFTLTNPPSKVNFLNTYPSAVQVDSIT